MDFLLDEEVLKKFLLKSIFDNDVYYLAIKKEDIFQVYESQEVVSVLAEELTPCLSRKTTGRPDDITFEGQKVILKSRHNVGELEIRNDSDKHYREMRFNMYRKRILEMLSNNFIESRREHKKVIFYKKN